jgi:hypothetical protein
VVTVTAETVMVMAAKAVVVATAALAARVAARSHKIRSKPEPTLAPEPSCSFRSDFSCFKNPTSLFRSDRPFFGPEAALN